MENNGSQRKLICPFCGAENNSDYVFCYKCGGSLVLDTPPGKDTVWAKPTNIGNVPEREVYEYVAGNQTTMRKFRRLSYGSTASWNWPVLILGLFNLQFVWFFYRKMYKLGALFLALSALITGISAASVIVAFDSVRGPIAEVLQRFVESVGSSGDYVISDRELSRLTQDITRLVMNALNSGTVMWMYIASQAASLLKFAMLIVIPIFADKAYYNKTMSELEKMNEGCVTEEAVAAAGRPNTLAAVLSGVFFEVASLIAISVPVMIMVNSILSSASVML